MGRKSIIQYDLPNHTIKNNQTSDLTVAVNGVKFYSWRPENTTGIQQKTIEIPLELIKETNTLTVEGQIINQAGNDMYNLIETPANWLTMYEGSNVNFNTIYNYQRIRFILFIIILWEQTRLRINTVLF